MTEAIVLHAFNYSESSRILRLATREAGVQSVLARGARASQRRFGSAVDLFAEGEVQYEVRTGRDLHTLAREAQGGRTVVLVSHTLTLVARFADQIVLMHNGRVAAAGSPRDVIQAATLESVYGWPLVVSHDPAVGAPTLVPLRRPR